MSEQQVVLQPGDKAPDFQLHDEQGQTVRLSDFRGQKVVLFAYPKDNTPGCTAEACDFRDNMARLESLGAQVLGISPDSAASHVKFKQKHNLPFPLLVDEDQHVLKAYGIWVKKQMFGRQFWGVERSTFIIDEEGLIQEAFRKVRVKGHVDQVIAALG